MHAKTIAAGSVAHWPMEKLRGGKQLGPALPLCEVSVPNRLERQSVESKTAAIPDGVMLLFRVLGIVVAVAIAVIGAGCDTLSPADITESGFITWQAQIEEYVEVNHGLPRTLMDLPRVRAEGRQLIKDGWGNEVAYSYTPDGQVTLVSQGPRKFLGKREPIIRRFRVNVASATSQSVTSSGVEDSRDHRD